MAARKPQSPQKTKLKAQPTGLPIGALRLAGKVAIITGGSRGIGYAIAKTLASEGCNVVITGRHKKQLAEAVTAISAALPDEAEAQVIGESCDVRDTKAVAALFATVKRRFGQLDILVNNAGITQPVVAVKDTSLQVWRDVVETNLTGVFLCTRAALPLMKAGATIINNLSAAARQVFPNYATYSAAKRGALGFTLSLREELIPRGIRVTALMTGATATDMWDKIMPDAPREKMIDVESVAQAVLYAVLLPPNVNLSELCLDPTGGAL